MSDESLISLTVDSNASLLTAPISVEDYPNVLSTLELVECFAPGIKPVNCFRIDFDITVTNYIITGGVGGSPYVLNTQIVGTYTGTIYTPISAPAGPAPAPLLSFGGYVSQEYFPAGGSVSMYNGDFDDDGNPLSSEFEVCITISAAVFQGSTAPLNAVGATASAQLEVTYQLIDTGSGTLPLCVQGESPNYFVYANSWCSEIDGDIGEPGEFGGAFVKDPVNDPADYLTPVTITLDFPTLEDLEASTGGFIISGTMTITPDCDDCDCIDIAEAIGPGVGCAASNGSSGSSAEPCTNSAVCLGSSGIYTPEFTGTLYALFNDTFNQYYDNTGSFTLNWSGGVITIPGNDYPGVPIPVTAGVAYPYTASGTINNGTGDLFGPDGNSAHDSVSQWTPAPLCSYGALVGLFVCASNGSGGSGSGGSCQITPTINGTQGGALGSLPSVNFFNNGASFPAGTYTILYASGAVSNINGNANTWAVSLGQPGDTVGAGNTGTSWFSPGRFNFSTGLWDEGPGGYGYVIVFNNGTTYNNIGWPTTAGTTYDTDTDAQTGNAGISVSFDHSGGPIGMSYTPSINTDNAAGPDTGAPTFVLTPCGG